MSLERKDYCSRLMCIQNIFRAAVKEVFTSQCSCEEAELHSFFVEYNGSTRSIYFDGECLAEDAAAGANVLKNSTWIEEYLQTEFQGRKYILEESETDREGGRMRRIIWVLFSECLDHNHGKLVLRCFFHQLAAVFESQLRKTEVCMPEEESFQMAALTQFVSEAAEEQINFYFRKMFSTFNVDFVNELSGQYYEKSECVADMIFLPYPVAQNLGGKELRYHFEKIAFVPSNARLIRKLLEMARKDLCLVLGENDGRDFFQVIGLCEKKSWKKICRDQSGRIVPCINVRIRNHMRWDLLLNETYIFTCKNGHFKIERPLQKEFLLTKLKEYFGEQDGGYEKLTDSIILSTGQGHGTMLVIMNEMDAGKETKRLGAMQYGLPESRYPMQPKGMELNCLNAIDGSVMIDTKGKVHGIGLILDGMSEQKGSMARGARYNSAIKYAAYLRRGADKEPGEVPVKAMILVVSEDGSADIVSV